MKEEEKKLRNWYKKMSEQLSEEPSQAVWDNIAKTLEVQKQKTILRKGFFFAGAALCFIFFSTFISVKKEIIHSENGMGYLNPAIRKEPLNTENENLRSGNNNEQLTVKNKQLKTGNQKLKANAQPLNSDMQFETSIEKQINNDEKLTLETIQPITILQLVSAATPCPLHTASYQPPTANHQLPTTCFIGFSTSIFNNWLLNNNTYNSFNSNSLSQVAFSLGTNVGISAGVNFSEYNAVQAEVVFKNTMGQRYKIYNEGHLVENEIQLQYSQINLLFKKKKTLIIGEKSVSFNMLAGPYFALLHKNETFTSKTSQYNPDTFRNYDGGINIGAEYEFHLNEEIAITTGIRAAFGLVNIYKEEYKTPANITTSRNLSMGCNVGLHYAL